MPEQILETRFLTETLFQDLKRDIPGGVNSPVRSFPGLELTPMIVERGAGDVITDVDGRDYIDFCGSWGALIHGHAHPLIVQAAIQRIAQGSSFGITTEVESKIASKIKNLVPSIEKIRFVTSGTEATMSAVRLARAFTGRDLIVKFSGHYHGHSDAFLMQAGSGLFSLNPISTSAGVPHDYIKNTISLPFNDCEAFLKCLENFSGKIACVILEPVAANMGVVPATKQFIHLLRALTKKQGIVCIFDEVITGFRLGLTGAQGYFGIAPDMTCFGKIIGGGFPVAAFGGKEEIMNLLAPLGPVYQAGTLSGNPVAMEAGLQALNLLEEPYFYRDLEEKTNIITDPIRAFLKRKNANASLQQAGSLFTLFFGKQQVRNKEEAQGLDLNLFAKFFRYLFERGVYVVPSQYEANFVSSAHTIPHLEYTRDQILSFLELHVH